MEYLDGVVAWALAALKGQPVVPKKPEKRAPAPMQPQLEQLISDQLRGSARLVTVEGCPRRDALALAAQTAHGLERGVLVVDGEALAPLSGVWWLLAAARREADLEGDVLVVAQSAAL